MIGVGTVFPAYAGMIGKKQQVSAVEGGISRIRRDDWVVGLEKMIAKMYFPHTPG